MECCASEASTMQATKASEASFVRAAGGSNGAPPAAGHANLGRYGRNQTGRNDMNLNGRKGRNLDVRRGRVTLRVNGFILFYKK